MSGTGVAVAIITSGWNSLPGAVSKVYGGKGLGSCGESSRWLFINTISAGISRPGDTQGLLACFSSHPFSRAEYAHHVFPEPDLIKGKEMKSSNMAAVLPDNKMYLIR